MRLAKLIIASIKYLVGMWFSPLSDKKILHIFTNARAMERVCPKCGLYAQRLKGRLILKINGEHFQARRFYNGIIVDEQLPNLDWREVYRSGSHIKDKKFLKAFKLADTCSAP